jgi:hypothetical protein
MGLLEDDARFPDPEATRQLWDLLCIYSLRLHPVVFYYAYL